MTDRHEQLEARLRAHFADRAAREPVPGGADGAPSIPGPPARSWWRRPPVLAAAAALLVIAALASALALAGDDPQELDVVGPSTTTTETTVATTATAPPGTSTTATSTTPPDPAAAVRSVIVSVDGVLGWWDGSRFVRWDAGEPIPAAGGETYTLVGLGGTSTAAGSAPRPGCGISGEGYGIDVGLEYPDDPFTPPPIAVSGVADPVPRELVALGAQDADVQAASEALAGLGVDDPSPRLAQVLRTDFEGDGRDEVLLVAERLADPSTLFAEPGDYSVLLLRQVVGEQLVTSVVEASIASADPGESPFVFAVRVAAGADLNGDGAMELLTRGVYYEGAGTAAWAVDASGGARRLLDVGCGA